MMEVLCPICNDPFTDPRELPCRHVICASCISAIHFSSPIKTRCPFCRTPFKCPEGDISFIPVSQLHLDLIRSNKQNRTAGNDSDLDTSHEAITLKDTNMDNGSKEQTRIVSEINKCNTKGCGLYAKYYCLNGCGYICSACHKTHNETLETKGHDSLSASSIGLSQHNFQHTRCLKHPENSIISYCVNCISHPLKCQQCELEDKEVNRSHRFKSLEEAVTQMEKYLDDAEQSISRQIELASEEKDAILSKTESIEDSAETLKENGRARFREYRAEIEKYLEKVDEMERDFIEKVEELHAFLLKELELSLSEIDTRENYLRYIRDLIQETDGEWKSGTKDIIKLSYVSDLARQLKAADEFPCPSMQFTSVWDLKGTDINTDIDVRRQLAELKDNLKYPQYGDWIHTKGENRVITRKLDSFGPDIRKSFVTTGARVLGNLWGLAIDDVDKHVYVTDHQNGCIHKFSLDLKERLGQTKPSRLINYGRKAEDQLTLTSPFGVAVSPNGHLIVIDNGAHKAVIIGNDLRYLGELNGFKNPCNAAFDSEGSLFITDLGNSRVRKYIFNSTESAVSSSFGYYHSFDFTLPQSKLSNQHAEPWAPESVAVTRQGELCVMGRGSDAIHVFDKGGRWSRSLKLRRVGHSSLCRGPADTLIVSDYASNRIDFVSVTDGSVVHSISSPPTSPGHLRNPTGIAIGPDDLLYACEFSLSRVVAF